MHPFPAMTCHKNCPLLQALVRIISTYMIGETFAGFPLYSMIGRFADIRINATHSLQLREAIVWNEKLTSSSDGELVHFDVERSNWTTITDKFGTAQIPMRQVLTMESRDYFIKMDFVTKEDSYNRLLFPFRYDNNNIILIQR